MDFQIYQIAELIHSTENEVREKRKSIECSSSCKTD